MASKSTDYNPASHFDQQSSVYDQFIGLLTGDIAHYILDNLIQAPTSGTVIHDNACGTGLVTEHLQTIAGRQDPPAYAKVHATDFVPSVTEVMKKKAQSQGWKDVDVSVMDSQALTFPDASFDLSIMNFGIFFLPEPQKGADHVFRTLKPGGTAIITSWKERRIMDAVVEAQRAIRPDLHTLAAPWGDLWSKEETLRDVLLKAGFRAENVKIVERKTDKIAHAVLADPDLVRKSYPAATEGWSDDDRAKLGSEIVKIAREKDLKSHGAAALYCVAFIAIAKK